MTSPLSPCEHCHRHIRSTEASCPFCGASTSRASNAVASPSFRLARGAWYAFRVGMAGAVIAGCAESSEPTADAAIQDAAAEDTATADAAIQDAAARDAATADSAADAEVMDSAIPEFDAGNQVPLYAAAPPLASDPQG